MNVREELWQVREQRWFGPEATQAGMLIGGLGTGCFTVGNRGQLKDWELFHAPGKGNHLTQTFFAVRVQEEGRPPVAAALEGELVPPFEGSTGLGENAGIPRFSRVRMKGEYPFATVQLSDDRLPVQVELEAFNPFIPLDTERSGIPAGILRYRVKNTAPGPVSVSVAGSMGKFSLAEGPELMRGTYEERARAVEISARAEGRLHGLVYQGVGGLEQCSMALAVLDGENVSETLSWLSGGWFDGLQGFWDDFVSDGALEANPAYTQKDAKPGVPAVASLCSTATLAAGEEKDFTFLISWYFPERIASWNARIYRAKEGLENDPRPDFALPKTRVWYAEQFSGAWDAAKTVAEQFESLSRDTRRFHDALFGSTLPWYVIDAVSANLTVLRSPTCFRLADGTWMAWEGCFPTEGSCEGNCTHVWNYAQSCAFLFPELERSTRRVDFLTETDPDGRMYFRSYQTFGHSPSDEPPAADGQMGDIVRLYREWKLSPDDSFLRELWPAAKRALDFAFRFWDTDGDFVLDGSRHNTYDIQFQGSDSLTGSLFYAALAAGAEMAKAMGDEEAESRYRRALAEGSAAMDALLWNGVFYRQSCADVDEYRYQYGDGCLSDQVFGQLLAHIAGLGYVLPEAHVKSAVKAVFDRNFIRDFRTHTNLQRTYVLNGESGLALCTWKDGGRPKIPFPYSDEVWTGIEYQVASHLIYEGFVDEGLTIARSTRERQDGVRRNPWNEVECGNHYARSLASYGLLTALSGMRYDIPNHKLSLRPAVDLPFFRTFFCAGTCWGVYTRTVGEDGSAQESMEILGGSL